MPPTAPAVALCTGVAGQVPASEVPVLLQVQFPSSFAFLCTLHHSSFHQADMHQVVQQKDSEKGVFSTANSLVVCVTVTASQLLQCRWLLSLEPQAQAC